MSFEYHHLDKFGYANLDLCEELLESEKKAIVLISGASSSGKSFSAEYLRELLERNGHHGHFAPFFVSAFSFGASEFFSRTSLISTPKLW